MDKFSQPIVPGLLFLLGQSATIASYVINSFITVIALPTLIILLCVIIILFLNFQLYFRFLQSFTWSLAKTRVRKGIDYTFSMYLCRLSPLLGNISLITSRAHSPDVHFLKVHFLFHISFGLVPLLSKKLSKQLPVFRKCY